jgi:hypothetical protein
MRIRKEFSFVPLKNLETQFHMIIEFILFDEKLFESQADDLWVHQAVRFPAVKGLIQNCWMLWKESNSTNREWPTSIQFETQ